MKNKPRQVILSEIEWKMVHNALLIRIFSSCGGKIDSKYEKLTKKLEQQLGY